MSASADNPVGRLLTIVRRTMEIQQLAGGAQARVGWARVFDLQEHNNALEPEVETEVCLRLIQLRKLITEAEEAIQDLEGLHTERYLRPFVRLRMFVPLTDLMSQFNQTLGVVTESDMTLLEMASDELSSRHVESVVEEDELKVLREQVDELFDKIKQSNLNDQLKVFILSQLATIRRAIDEYRIRGTERLQEALAEIIGGIYLHQDIIQTEKDKHEVSLYKQVVSRFCSVVLTAAKLTPLLGPASKVLSFLTSGAPDIPPVDLPK